MKKESYVWPVAILVVFFLVSVAESFAQAKKVEDVEIALQASLTGRGAPWGLQVQRMAALVEKEVNDAGGIKEFGGAKLKIRLYDNESKPAVGATEALKAITTSKAVVLMGANMS